MFLIGTDKLLMGESLPGGGVWVCGCVRATLELCMWVGVYSHKHTFPHACKTDAVCVSGVHKICGDTKLS